MSEQQGGVALKGQDANSDEAVLRDIRLATCLFTGTVVVGFVVYWVVQIQSVREMLALAYG